MVFVVTFKLAGLSLEGFWEQRLWPQDAKGQVAWGVQQHRRLAAAFSTCLSSTILSAQLRSRGVVYRKWGCLYSQGISP